MLKKKRFLLFETENVRNCKYDWHQTAGNVVIAIYAKGTIPDLSQFEVNRVHFRSHMEYDYGLSVSDLDIPLWGVRIFSEHVGVRQAVV